MLAFEIIMEAMEVKFVEPENEFLLETCVSVVGRVGVQHTMHLSQHCYTCGRLQITEES